MTKRKSERSLTITQVRSLARGYTKRAIQVLGGYLESEDVKPEIRVMAAKELLDRGWGKPSQPIAGDETQSLELIRRVIIDAEVVPERKVIDVGPSAPRPSDT
jgi:hypothetical protein